MTVRLAVETDKAAVNELRRQVMLLHAASGLDFFPSEFSQALADYLDFFFKQEDREVLVAEKNGGIVGFVCLEYVDRPGSAYFMPQKYCHIMELGVDEQCRRQGIGKALFEAVKERAQEKGFARMELNMWEFNEGALKFYESMGFHTFRRYMEYP